MPSVTVIIPALNEEGGIGSVLAALKMLPFPCEVIVIDDGSTDRTGAIAREGGARVLRHPVPAGYGKSIKDGIGIATGEILVLSDADGTYPIERMPDLLKGLEAGFDMTVGARQGPEYRGSFFKAPARAVFKILAEFTTGTRIPDVNSGLRAFRRADVLPHLGDLCNGFSFTTTITLLYILTGKLVGYVPIDYRKRVGRSKVRMLRDTIRTLQYLTEAILRHNPMKFFLPLAGITFIVAVIGQLLGSSMTLFIGIFIALLIFGMGGVAVALRRE